MDKAVWESLKALPGFEYGNNGAKVQVLGLLDVDAPAASANILAGQPNKTSDMGCKTIMLTNGTHLAWNYTAKLRLAYSTEPKYRVPGFKFDTDGKIVDPKGFALKQEYDALPSDVRKRVEALEDEVRAAAKGIKRNTFFAQLPSGEVVEIGHPFKVDAVWADYLTVLSGDTR